jgi:hypothetical protein
MHPRAPETSDVQPTITSNVESIGQEEAVIEHPEDQIEESNQQYLENEEKNTASISIQEQTSGHHDDNLGVDTACSQPRPKPWGACLRQWLPDISYCLITFASISGGDSVIRQASKAPKLIN